MATNQKPAWPEPDSCVVAGFPAAQVAQQLENKHTETMQGK